MKLLKRGAVLIGALLMTLLMSVGVFADEAWTKADVTNSSIGVSKQTTELKSLSYIADEGISLNVDNDKVSVSGKGIGTGSTVYVSNSTDTETGLANATYNKVDNGAKTGIVYFDSKKIDVRHVTSYFNIKIETGSKSTVIKVKTTVAYGDLYVYAFQMNTKHNDGAVSEYNPSYRVVNYCGNVLAKGNDLIPVRGFGTVYGINGTFTKNDLVKNSSNANVYSFDATEQGLVDVKNATQWDNYYAVTFKNLSYNPELLDRSYTLRPYAILEDGSIMYSDDVQSTSIYDVANVLYERNAMSTKEARAFLYKHILNIVKLKNNYVNICKNMLHVFNVTDVNSADYKFVNALYKDLYCYVQLTHDYENAHYYDRDNFIAKTFVDGQDPNTVLLDKLNKATGTDYDTILDWINFESPKNGVEGGYVPAGVYEDGKLTKDWSDLVKDGDVVVDDETLKSVSDNVNGDLQLPESIKKIESAKGSNLDTVTVPSTVEEISDDAFTEVPKVIYNGDATGARWGADITIVKGNSIKIPVYAGYNSNNKTLYFAKTAKELEDAGVTENYGDISSVGFTKYNSAPWYSINWQITKVNFLSEIKPTSCSYWFYCFTSLADIDNIQNLNTKNVTNMSYMFSYCGALTSLDVSNFDTSKVTRMDWMFYNCYILTSLDLSNFDTRKVTDMSYMLGLCNEVTSLDVSNFDTSKVTRMNGMFSGCRALTTLNVSNFDTSKVTDMSSMFSYCSKLTTLDVSNFDTSKVAYMGSMFDGCTSLTTLNISNFDTSKATRMNGMFNNCSSLTTLDVSNFDTRNVTYMSSMFSNCSKLTTLDLSSFDTSKVTDISSMFFNCTSLTTLNVSNFDTNRVTNMNSMFNSCTSLTTLDVSNFDISKVTSMNSMFNSCTSLTTLDVSNFDTSKVTDMSYMFSGCSSLTSLDISDFDTSKVTYMSGMFNNCSSLTTLDVSNFNTSKVTDMSYMFSGCSKLTTLDVSNFDTSKVTHMSYIFYNCSSLITLKLGIFNTSKVSSYSNIFSKINSNTILYTYSQNTKDWILNLSSSNRPSSWTTDNIKVICSKNESGHNFETITTEPTCTENGKQVKTCTYCGYKEEIVLKAGHNFEVVTNNEGNKELVCSRCNEHREYHDYTIDIISNTNYVQDNNKFTSNIKGVNNGKSSIELTLTVYETTNFNFKYKVSSESRYDKGSLTIDGVTVADAISGTSNSEQTYTKILVPGTYTITSSYMKDSSANNGDDCFYFTVECGHIWDNGTITKEPTCTEAGTKVYKCTNDDCDVTKTETIKALGHNWDNGIVTKEPTCTDTGTKICTCSRDNVTKTETIKALGHDYNDNNVCTRCNDKLENPIFVGYSSSDNTLYFASKQKEIKNAGIDLTSDNYYGDISKINFASTSAPWENNSNITQITFLSEIKPTSCSYWFYKLDGLTKINNIKNLNTENCTKMNGMFDGCSKLTSLDLSDFDTSKVTSMRAMFTNCYGLKTINLSNFDTSNVKNMGSMFYCCSNLTSLDLSNFNTGNVTDMRYMFLACSDLTSLDVNNFDTSNVTNMSAMFEECVSLTTIDVSNFNTSKVTDMSSMFDGGFGGHNSLTTLDLSNFDTSNVTDMSNMFSKCTSLTTLDISSFNTNKVTNLSDMFSKCNSLSSLDISNFDTSNVTKMDGMFDRCSSLTSLDVSNFNTSKVTNISGMFSNCSKLTTLDVSSFDTSKVTDISGMFYNCTSLTTLDVSNFNTSNVTTMKSMFAKCLKLTHIDGLENFNTSKVTDMSLMFGASSYIGDGKIIFDNISNWDTHNVKDMTCMFYGQGAQTELDISKWNVSNCTSFNHMFCDNNKLKKLDLSKWDVSNVKTVYDMFDDCYALTTIGNVSNWNTSNMVDLGGFMNGCNNFEGSNGTLDLSGWDTSNVISMGEMFRACKKLTQIKLNNFDTSKVTDGSWTGAGSGIYYEYGNNSNEYKGMSIMFKDCPNLTSIIVGSKWSTDGKTTTNMFLNCGTDHVTIQ